MRLVAVVGSVTPPGRLRRAVVEAVSRASERFAAEGRVIDLADVEIAMADGRAPEDLGDDTAWVVEAMAEADVVLLATPVYRGSVTGALKNLLDHVPVDALRGKPVAIAAMGASLHHYLGAERHLRDMLAFFGALVVPTAAYLVSADFVDGVPSERAAEELDALLAGGVALAGVRSEALGPPPLLARARG